MLDRKSNIFFVCLAAGFLLICVMLVHATLRQRSETVLLEERGEMVRVLGLTDLCLITEARYTRNPSLTDFHSPFQDHPIALEHFPSGSIMSIPPHLAPQVRK